MSLREIHARNMTTDCTMRAEDYIFLNEVIPEIDEEIERLHIRPLTEFDIGQEEIMSFGGLGLLPLDRWGWTAVYYTPEQQQTHRVIR